MKQIKSMMCVLALVLAWSLCLAVPAFGAESAVMWLEVQATDDGITVSVCANTTVADGQIEVHYDNRDLTYRDITTDNQYVLAHAVNPEKVGVVKIAWIASNDYGLDGTKHVLMQLHFDGQNVDGFYVSGHVFTPEGNQIMVEPPVGRDRLQAALESAKLLKPDLYTADSYAKLQDALNAARAELADPTVTQERLEAARQKVIDAVLSLIKLGEEPTVPATTQPTVPPTQPVTSGDEGANVGLIVAIAAVCVVGAVVVVIILKKRGTK